MAIVASAIVSNFLSFEQAYPPHRLRSALDRALKANETAAITI